MQRGKFVVFEGIDGCGKGTQMGLASSYVFRLNKNFNIVMTREPTSDFAQIREKMARGKNVADDREWYAQQFTEDRVNHCRKYISPDLDKGRHVFNDRFYYSTITYPGTQGLNSKDLMRMQTDRSILQPNMILIYDLSAEIAFERRKQEGATDVFDKDLEFQERLRQAYLGLPDFLPDEKIIIIDGSQQIQDVFKETKKHLDNLFS